MEKRVVLESLDIVMLAMDEICDGGYVIKLSFFLSVLVLIFLISSIIIEADPSSVVSRVALRNDDIPIGEQTVAQVTNAIHSLFW